MANTRNYKYVITLDEPLYPRKIVNDLSSAPFVGKHLLNVTDLQDNTHIYGDTYYVRWDDYVAHWKRQGRPLLKGME